MYERERERERERKKEGPSEIVPIIVASVKVDTRTFSNCKWCYIVDAIASKQQGGESKAKTGETGAT